MNRPIDDPMPTILSRIHCGLKYVASRASHPIHVEDALESLRALLTGLPLAMDEYVLATRHLDNVEQYLTAGESGAACYELQLLEGVCRHYAERTQVHDCPPFLTSGHPMHKAGH